MSKIPEYMVPLFNRCTPFTEPKNYFLGIEGISVGHIEILTENRIIINNITWDALIYGKVRVFQHDKNENEFYVATYPIYRLLKNSGGRFEWFGTEQVFDNLPASAVTFKARDYISPLVFEINNRRDQGILPPSIVDAVEKPKLIELKGELYGPSTRDEIISHMRLKFAYL